MDSARSPHSVLYAPTRAIGPCRGCPEGTVRDPGLGLERVALADGTVVTLHRGPCAEDFTAGRPADSYRFLDRDGGI